VERSRDHLDRQQRRRRHGRSAIVGDRSDYWHRPGVGLSVQRVPGFETGSYRAPRVVSLVSTGVAVISRAVRFSHNGTPVVVIAATTSPSPGPIRPVLAPPLTRSRRPTGWHRCLAPDAAVADPTRRMHLTLDRSADVLSASAAQRSTHASRRAASTVVLAAGDSRRLQSESRLRAGHKVRIVADPCVAAHVRQWS
jgi:hypothetical protein